MPLAIVVPAQEVTCEEWIYKTQLYTHGYSCMRGELKSKGT